MSPPTARPFPRFIADASQEGTVQGRFAERLTAEFTKALRAARRRRRLAARPGHDPLVSRPRVGRPRLRAGDRAGAGAVGAERRARGRRAGPGRVLRLGLVRAGRGWRLRRSSREGRLHRRHLRGQPRLAGGHLRRRDRTPGSPSPAAAATSLSSGACRWSAAPSRPPPSSTARSSTSARSRTGASRWSRWTRSHGFGDDAYLTVKLWDRRLGAVATESLYDESE